MKLYPFAPLADLMGLSEIAAARALRIGTRRAEYLSVGMSEKVADHMACKAGFHPFVVWPDMVDDIIESVGRACVVCDALFVPARSPDLTCSRACRLEYRRRWRRAYYQANGEYEREQERRRYYERKAS